MAIITAPKAFATNIIPLRAVFIPLNIGDNLLNIPTTLPVSDITLVIGVIIFPTTIKSGPTTAKTLTIDPIIFFVSGFNCLNQETKELNLPMNDCTVGINSLPTSKAISPNCLFNTSNILPRSSNLIFCIFFIASEF